MTQLNDEPTVLITGNVIPSDGTDGICLECNKNEVTLVVVGECDSFGCEYEYLCKPCYDKLYKDIVNEGMCDFCHKEAVLSFTRDFEEGSTGPVYAVCSPCRYKLAEKAQDELDFIHGR